MEWIHFLADDEFVCLQDIPEVRTRICSGFQRVVAHASSRFHRCQSSPQEECYMLIVLP